MATFKEKKEFTDSLRVQWNSMWQERIDDKVRAEGVTVKDYPQLFVERGTIIMATRNFAPLDFYSILEQHNKLLAGEPAVAPNPSIGGWNKFIRTNLKKSSQARKRRINPEDRRKEKQQLKKGGKGWLNFQK